MSDRMTQAATLWPRRWARKPLPMAKPAHSRTSSTKSGIDMTALSIIVASSMAISPVVGPSLAPALPIDHAHVDRSALGRQREARRGEARRGEQERPRAVGEGIALERDADEIPVELAVVVLVLIGGGGIGAGRQIERDGDRAVARLQAAVVLGRRFLEPFLGRAIDREHDVAAVVAEAVDGDGELGRARAAERREQEQDGKTGKSHVRFQPGVWVTKYTTISQALRMPERRSKASAAARHSRLHDASRKMSAAAVPVLGYAGFIAAAYQMRSWNSTRRRPWMLKAMAAE